MNDVKMTDRKPYLLRAMYQWISDNGCTAHLVVACPNAGWVAGVPNNLLQDEALVLNISPSASPDCVIEDEGVFFTTRFGGVPHQVSVLMPAVASIFARETQEGMGFDIPKTLAEGPQEIAKNKASKTEKQPENKAKIANKKTSHLKIIK